MQNKLVQIIPIILIITFIAFPVKADTIELSPTDKAIMYLDEFVPGENDGLRILAYRMAGKLEPLDEMATDYLLKLDDALASGRDIYAPYAVLGVTAAGMNVNNMQDGILLDRIAQLCNESYNPEILAECLFALSSNKYTLPNGSVSIETIIIKILGQQNPDGSFGAEGTEQMYITAKVVQALAYHRNVAGVQGAIDNAGGYMVNNQAQNASYPSKQGDVVSATTNSIIALELNGHDTTRLNGRNAINFLYQAQNSNGGFGSYVGAASDDLNTTYSIIALQTHQIRNTSAFNFTENLSKELPKPIEKPESTPEPSSETETSSEVTSTESLATSENTKEKDFLSTRTVLNSLIACAVIGILIPIMIILIIKKIRK